MSPSRWLRATILPLVLLFALSATALAGQNVPGLDRGENGAPSANTANRLYIATPAACDEVDRIQTSAIHPTCAVD